MMPDEPLNFTNVEALRKHMLLTVTQMAKVLTVSRVTYTGWVNGKPIRKKNNSKVRMTLRKMMEVMTEQKWPSPEVIAMSSPQRFYSLVELIKKDE
jgi:DNA-binding XRE family transcriptional regulator